jgi:hypothetical protein
LGDTVNTVERRPTSGALYGQGLFAGSAGFCFRLIFAFALLTEAAPQFYFDPSRCCGKSWRS